MHADAAALVTVVRSQHHVDGSRVLYRDRVGDTHSCRQHCGAGHQRPHAQPAVPGREVHLRRHKKFDVNGKAQM